MWPWQQFKEFYTLVQPINCKLNLQKNKIQDILFSQYNTGNNIELELYISFLYLFIFLMYTLQCHIRGNIGSSDIQMYDIHTFLCFVKWTWNKQFIFKPYIIYACMFNYKIPCKFYITIYTETLKALKIFTLFCII